jgi:hypothetical protein
MKLLEGAWVPAVHLNDKVWWLAAVVLASSLCCRAWAVETPTQPTLDEVARLSQAGVPFEQIVAELRAHRANFAVTASDLLRLHDQGVPDAVLDYIQDAYAARTKEEARLRSLSMGKGPGVNR